MSKETYDRGIRDGRNNSTAGKPTKPFIVEIVEGYSKKEINDLNDWKQGYEHGRKSRS